MLDGLQNNEEDKPSGWSTSYYDLPDGAKDLQDLIEYRNMNFAIGNIFKAVFRLGEKAGTDATYDLNKIIWFAQRELAKQRSIKSDDSDNGISGDDRRGNSTTAKAGGRDTPGSIFCSRTRADCYDGGSGAGSADTDSDECAERSNN